MREAMSLHEIVLPETKPETEWILGRAVQKVSPFRRHAVLQGRLAAALGDWAADRAQVGTEWRFRVAPPGEIRRPLVPDVSLVWNDRLRDLDDADVELPPFAPDIAIEVRSPGDRIRFIEHKVAVYLAGGATLVAVVDPMERAVHLHDRSGTRVLRDGEQLEHPALPGFSLSVRSLFDAAERPR